MLKKNLLTHLIGFRESIIEYQRAKPFEFQILQTLFIIVVLVITVAFFSAISSKKSVDDINERAEVLKAEMIKFHDLKMTELRKESESLKNQRLLNEAQARRENDEKNELFKDGKNLEKNERTKLEELNQLKSKNDLKGYSHELIKNLGY